MKTHYRKNSFLPLAAALAMLVNHASAGTTWDGGAPNGNWQNAINWDSNVLPTFDATTDLLFREADSGRTASYIQANREVRSLTFNSFVTTDFIVGLTNGNANAALNLTMGDATNAAAITVDSGAGNIRIGTNTNATAGSIILANNLAVAQNSTTSTLTIDRPITESGGARTLTKTGAGTLVFSGANTYTGATNVTAGTLRVNGTTAAGSTVAVSAGATLGGTGTIGGIVNVSGVLSPGASIETLNTGTLSLANGSSLVHELNSGVATAVGSDLLLVTGDLNLVGTVGLTLSDLTTPTVVFNVNDVFSIINYTGTWNGGLFTFGGNELTNAEEFSFGLNTWRIDYNAPTGGLNFTGEYAGGSDSFVNLTVIPEPDIAALIGAFGAILLLSRRR